MPTFLVMRSYLCRRATNTTGPGYLFIKRTDVLRQDLVKSRGRKVRIGTFLIVLEFDWHLGSSAAELPVEFQTDRIIIAPNLAASRFDSKTFSTSCLLNQ